MAKSISKINITLSARIGNFRKNFNKAGKSMKKFKRAGRGMFRGMQGGFTRMIAMVFALRAALIGISNVMKAVFERETLFSKLQIFERTVAKTKKTFQELEDFSAKTPFLPAEIIKGFTLLRALGGEALGTVDMVKKLGDAAVTTGVGFDIIAANVGRMFNALKKGNIGQTANELRSYGLLSTEVQDKIEAMGKAGASQAKLFDVFLQGLKKFDGALEVMSQTMTGVISTMKGLLVINLARGMEPWIAVIKQFMIQTNKAGGFLQGFARKSKAAFKVLQDVVFGKGLVNPAIRKFIGLMIVAPKIIVKSLKEILGLFRDLFGFVGKEIKGLTGSGLLDMLNGVIEMVLKGIIMVPQLLRAITSGIGVVQELASTGGVIWMELFKSAGAAIEIIINELNTNIKGFITDVLGAFQFALVKILNMPWHKLKDAFLSSGGISGALIKEFTSAFGIINSDLKTKFEKTLGGVNVAIEQSMAPFAEATAKFAKDWTALKKLFKDVNVGEVASAEIQKALSKMKELMMLAAQSNNLAAIKAAKASKTNKPFKKFADLINKGSDAAFKAIIGHMFDGRESTPVEEKQLKVQQEQLAVQRIMVEKIGGDTIKHGIRIF